MIILGICDGHGASAALMIDGEVVGAIQEERLTKVKNQSGFPDLAISELVSTHLSGRFDHIDEVALATHRIDPYAIALDRYSRFGVDEWIQENHKYWKPMFYGDPESVESYWLEQLKLNSKQLSKKFDFSFLGSMSRDTAIDHFNNRVRIDEFRRVFHSVAPVYRYQHHCCHAAYALHGAEIPDTHRARVLVLTADAWGDDENWSASLSNGCQKLTRIAGGADHLVARIYKFTTLILGMKPNEHEYKVMGLSAYVDPRRHYAENVKGIFLEILDFVDGAFVSRKKLRDGYFDLRDRLEGHRFDNVAAGLQAWATEVTTKWARYWLIKTESRALCYSGGLSMNIKTNGELLHIPELEYLSVPASGGDESLSIGACYLRGAEIGPVTAIRNAYLGGLAKIGFNCPDEFVVLDGFGDQEIARLLASDIVVARCIGRGEFGARALGNRSILANPSNFSNLRKINESIKNRDFWMPFTPSIIEESASEYLVNPKNILSTSMTIGFATFEQARGPLAAALHPADFSARPQIVRKAENPSYWHLIDEFRKISGIPALLNTSLNLHGEPMNYTIDDAISTVARSGLICLSIANDTLLCKKSKISIVLNAVGRSNGSNETQ